MRLWMDPHRCRGCLRCELACSFHHGGHRGFRPSLSSTRVLRAAEDKAITMILADGCDLCAGEAAPLCVEACAFGARGVTA